MSDECVPDTVYPLCFHASGGQEACTCSLTHVGAVQCAAYQEGHGVAE